MTWTIACNGKIIESLDWSGDKWVVSDQPRYRWSSKEMAQDWASYLTLLDETLNREPASYEAVEL